jgi:hypothetical protein
MVIIRGKQTNASGVSKRFKRVQFKQPTSTRGCEVCGLRSKVGIIGVLSTCRHVLAESVWLFVQLQSAPNPFVKCLEPKSKMCSHKVYLHCFALSMDILQSNLQLCQDTIRVKSTSLLRSISGSQDAPPRRDKLQVLREKVKITL